LDLTKIDIWETCILPYSDEKGIVFLHVPKTGGTAVVRFFNIRSLHDWNPEVRPSPQHLTCEMLRKKIGNKKYEDYYKFAFVRNPWARILSSYFWRQTLPKKRPVLPFPDFVETARQAVTKRRFYDQDFSDHFIPQVEYTVDVDDIFRFEEFDKSIKVLAAKLGIETEPVPPRKPKPHDRYWTYYDNQTRSVIAEIYREEIEQFDYRYWEI